MNELSGTVEMVTDMRARIDAVIEAHRTGSWQAQTHFLGDRVSFLTGTSKARPEDPNQLTRHTGEVIRREVIPAAPGSSFGFVQYDIRDDATGRVINVNSGRVRMLDDQTRPVLPFITERTVEVETVRGETRKIIRMRFRTGVCVMITTYDDAETGRRQVRVNTWGADRRQRQVRRASWVKPAPAGSIRIGERFDVERYGMRGHAGRPSDRVTHWSRMINGKRFDFSRVVWGDTGDVSTTVYEGRTTNQLHHWTRQGAA